jgi:Bacterial pre-peptidase C-terminal domain
MLDPLMKTRLNCLIMSLAALSTLSASAATLVNGANQTGIIFTNTVADSYTFTANTGDSINLRLGTTNFSGELQLYGPNGALLETVGQYPVNDDLIAYTATNSGTFTVLVSSVVIRGTGTYALHLAQVPEAFIVPAGDEGGAMTNGGNFIGTITLGDLDMFTFTANTGDSINLRLGTTNFSGRLQLYGPNGALLETVGSYPVRDDLIAYTATNSGTFTVLVSDAYGGETGTYALHLAQIPEAFIVPAGDEGGPMTNGGNFTGTITLGDLDMWTFTACRGDVINLELKTTNFYGNLQLYGPNGALLETVGSYPVRDDLIAYTATNCGTFTVLVSDVYGGETGTYGLTANGIFDVLRLFSPVISGTNLMLKGAGGTTNAGFVLYSTTNITTPWGLWTPVLTNHFDQFRVFNYTNGYNPAQPQKYFRFVVP